MKTHKLVLLRHGKTQFNLDRIFCGWTDVDMTREGEEDCKKAGELLKKNGYKFDIAFTSYLKRAKKTTELVLKSMGTPKIPTENDWRLNERHYGALQGIRHEEMEKKVGKEQVFLWRRSYSTRPPLLEKEDPRYPGKDPMYAALAPEQIPRGESLEDTIKRVLPCWHEKIAPAVRGDKSVLVSASGNSLRALVKYLDKVPDDEIPKLEIPQGKPLIYELDENLRPIRHYYLE